MSVISQYVLILAVQVSLISAIAYIAMAIFRKSHVSVHAIGIACTLLLVASPALVAILPFNGLIASAFTEQQATIQEQNRVEELNRVEVSTASQKPPKQIESQVASIELSSAPMLSNVEHEIAPPEPVFVPAESQQPSQPISIDEPGTSSFRLSNVPILLGLLWLSGATCLAAIRLRGYLRLRAALKGVRRVDLEPQSVAHLSKVFGYNVHPDIRICDAISVPFVLGILKPRIFVPSYVWESPQHRRDVITHELAHIVRHDHWYHLAQRLASILYWWQPLVHAIIRRISATRETIADNFVLRGSDSGSYASTLLAVAEHCVAIRSPKNALAFLAQQPALEQRVAAILDESRSLQVRSVLTARLAITAIASLLICIGGGIGVTNFKAVAQETNKNQPSTSNEPASSNVKITTNEPNSDRSSTTNAQMPHSVSGRILNAKGNPIADCLLVVRAYARDGADLIQSVRSDSQGNYKMDLPPIFHLGSHQGWAYKDGYNMRTVFFASPLWKNITSGLDITLLDQDATEIAIVSPEGNPVSDVVITPETYWVPMSSFSEIPKEPHHSPTPIPDEIAKQIQAVTNAEGKAKIVGLSPKLVFGLHAVTKEYGEEVFNLDFRRLDQAERFSLSPTRAVHGVLHTNNPTRFKGKLIELRSRGGSIRQQGQPTRGGFAQPQSPGGRGSGFAKVEIDANGEFQIPAMAIGEITPSFRLWGSDKNVVPILATKQSQLPNFQNPQEELKLEFSLMRTVQVQGRLLKADTKEPISDAHVSFYNRSLAIGAQCCTDENGKFSVNVPPGASESQVLHLSSTFNDYDLPSNFTINVDPSEDTMQINDLLADPWPHWTVHMNNADGAPIANHHVALTYQGKDQPRTIYMRGKSDADGNAPMRFSKKALPVIDKGEFSFYSMGSADATAVDPNGSLKVERRTESEIWLVQHEPNKKQDSSAIEPDSPDARKKNDQGQLSSNQSMRTASGRILDTKGKPVAGCELISTVRTSDGSKEVRAKSDDEGKYEIKFPGDVRYASLYLTWTHKEGFNTRPVCFGRYLNDNPNATSLDIVLPDLQEIQIKVQTPDGKPLSNAVVKPMSYEWPNGSFTADEPQGLGGPLPSFLLEKNTGVTDAEGIAKLVGFSAGLIGDLTVTTQEFGDQVFFGGNSNLVTCRLLPVGTIRGTVISNNPSLFEGKVIHLDGKVTGIEQGRGTAKATADAQGKFVVPAFAVGEVMVNFGGWNDKAFTPLLTTRNLTVRKSEELKLHFSLLPTIEVRGRILKADTKEPIPDSSVSIWNEEAIIQSNVRSNADGSFVGRIAPGSVKISVHSFGALGNGYDYPEALNVDINGDKEQFETKDLLATPYPNIILHIEDADHKPIADRDVSIAIDPERAEPLLLKTTKSDSSGTAHTVATKDIFGPVQGRYSFYLTASSDELIPANRLYVSRTNDNNEIWLTTEEPPKPTPRRRPRVQ